MKGIIDPDHIPKNKFTLRIRGMREFVFTKIGGLEEELEVVDIPDRTRASGGQTKAGDTTVELPTHHIEQIQAMEDWLIDSTDPVDPQYKKTGVLTKTSISGQRSISYTLIGLFPSKRATPDSEMENEGEMDVTTYTLNWDDIIPRVS